MIWNLKDIRPGDLYTTDGKDAWEVESFCESPTITLRNLRTGERAGGAVGCLNVSQFIPLIPKVNADERT